MTEIGYIPSGTRGIGTEPTAGNTRISSAGSAIAWFRGVIAGPPRGRVFLIVNALVLLTLTGFLVHPLAMQQPVPPMPLVYAFVQSPNCDDRPVGATVNCIVVHATVEPTTEGTMGIFLSPAKQVSAHFVVGRDGRVVQMVPIEKRAWHAGVSVLDGVGSVNNYSVGIEMVNLNDGNDPYTPEQIESVAGIIRLVRSRYNVPDERIVSHAQIALPAGRKSDPAGFDFEKLRALARVGVAVEPKADAPKPPAALEEKKPAP